MKAKDLIERGALLFSERRAVTTLWQEIAENFYPQRADFTLTRYIGEEFANHLYSSYPLLVHRDLSSSFAAMLRPRRKDWFEVGVDEMDKVSKAGIEWLQWATKRMKSAMYDRKANFVRATTEGDADFAAFGQCLISRETNWNTRTPHLLYRCWHLRDAAWSEMATGSIGEIYVKWKPTIKVLKEMFGSRVHQTFENKTDNQTLQKTECMRLVVSTDIYRGQNGEGEGYPWMLVYLDILNNHIMEEQGLFSHGFTLPRWQTVSGSQYAYSPATVAGLPDARLLQAMTLTLLEAGEMSVRPPMIATIDAVRGDIQLYSGGITWADAAYDEKLGEVLRPLTQDRRGLPIGYNVHDAQMAMLADAFFLNKLTLPPPEKGVEMTAYEVGQRIEEYIRAALPLFEPMEHEYNGQLCEDTFDALMRAGAFGSPQDIPPELQGRNVHFKFISPLHDAIERKDASVFMESADLIERAVQMDPTALAHMDIGMSLRDALSGIGLKEERLRSLDEVDELIEQAKAMQQAQEGAEIADTAASAEQKLAQAEAA